MTQKTKKTMIKSASVAIGLSLLLWGCGGGGGGDGPIAEATTKLTGVAIDGYLERATAFLDLNDNGKHDPNEPQSTTGKQGDFELNATASQFAKHRVVVTVPIGAKDSITGDVDAPFSLTSPAGHGSVVSPLTTLVAAHMADGLSFEDARIKVKQELRLDDNVMKDFMADKDLNFQKVAVAVTEILKTTDIASSKEQLSDIKSNVDLKVQPNLVAISEFDTDHVDGWSQLQAFSKVAAQAPALELNSQWVKFLRGEPPVITSVLVNDSDFPSNLINFSISKSGNNFQLGISALNQSITRGLSFDDDLNLINVTSGSEHSSLQFTDADVDKSLPAQVSLNSSGSYFVGQDLSGCKTSSSYFTRSAINGNLNFSLTLVSSLEDRKPCGSQRPTLESFNFLLTKDGLFLEKATTEFGEFEIELIFQSSENI